MDHLLATQQWRTLKPQEIAFVERVWRAHREKADLYGPANEHACVKLRRFEVIDNRRGQHIENGPAKLTPGWIGFLHYHKILPIGYGQMSHQCGCKLCINGLSVFHEPKSVNLKRRMCHRAIKTFEKEVRNTEGRVSGMVTMDIVCIMRRNHPPCTHEPPCFVNFGCVRHKSSKK
jgi:hypothetical protein